MAVIIDRYTGLVGDVAPAQKTNNTVFSLKINIVLLYLWCSF